MLKGEVWSHVRWLTAVIIITGVLTLWVNHGKGAVAYVLARGIDWILVMPSWLMQGIVIFALWELGRFMRQLWRRK